MNLKKAERNVPEVGKSFRQLVNVQCNPHESSISSIIRSSHLLMFYEISVKYFAKFTGKHQSGNLFFNKVPGVQACNFIERILQHRCFSVNCVKFLRNTFFHRTSPGDWFWIMTVSCNTVCILAALIIYPRKQFQRVWDRNISPKWVIKKRKEILTKPVITSSKSTIETLEHTLF